MLAAGASARGLSKQPGNHGPPDEQSGPDVAGAGPALVPVGAAAVPAIAGLANQLGFAAAGAGVAAVAFKGVGDALKAVNDYAHRADRREPARSSRETMKTLGPAGREFVMFLQELRPQMQELAEHRAGGPVPRPRGRHDRPDDAASTGSSASSTSSRPRWATSRPRRAQNLAGPGWTEFFDFLEREARPTLISMAATMGNFARGFAELWMAFDPLSDQFSAGFLQMSRDFATWADGLSQTQGFQDFIAYIQDTLPQVGATFGAFGNMLLQLLQAAAPVGAAALAVLEPIFDVIAAIANTPIGTTLIGLGCRFGCGGSRPRDPHCREPVAAHAVVADQTSAHPPQGLTDARFTYPDYPVTDRGVQGTQGRTGPARGFAAAGRGRAVGAHPDAGKAGRTTPVRRSRRRTSAAASKEMAAAQRSAVRAYRWRCRGGGRARVRHVRPRRQDGPDEHHDGRDDRLRDSRLGHRDRCSSGVGARLRQQLMTVWATRSIGPSAAANNSLSVQTRIAAIDAEIAAVKRLKAEKQTAGTVAQSEVTGGTSTRGPETGAEDAAMKKLAATKRDLARASQDALFAEFGLTGAMKGSSQASRDAAAANLTRISSINALQNEMATAFDAETAYRQAVLAARDAGKENNAGIEKNTAAANANRAALSQLRGAWNALADAGGQTIGTLKKARSNFVELAVSMGVPRAEAKRLARELLNLPNPKPKITLEGVEGALNKISNVRQRLLSLDGTTARTFVQIKESYADGGLVRRYDTGGRVSGPGGPRDDKVPAMLSNGEFVVNAAATKRFLPELHRMNAQNYAAVGRCRCPSLERRWHPRRADRQRRRHHSRPPSSSAP